MTLSSTDTQVSSGSKSIESAFKTGSLRAVSPDSRAGDSQRRYTAFKAPCKLQFTFNKHVTSRLRSGIRPFGRFASAIREELCLGRSRRTDQLQGSACAEWSLPRERG